MALVDPENDPAVTRQVFHALNSIAEGFILFDRDERVVLGNSRLVELLPKVADLFIPGARLEDIVRTAVDRNHYQLIDGRTPEDIEEIVAYRLARHRDAPSHHEQLLSDGTWVACTSRPTPDGGSVLIFQDITPHKQAEIRLRDAIESLPNGLALTDADDRLVSINSRALSLFHHIRDLFEPGRTIEEIYLAAAGRDHYPSDRGDALAQARRRLDQHRRAPVDIDIALASGQWLRVSERRTQEGGWVITWTDISELKSRQEELADKSTLLDATLDAIDQGFAVFDNRERLRFWNTTWVELMGLTESEVAAGLTLADVVRSVAERGAFGPGDPAEATRRRLDVIRASKPGPIGPPMPIDGRFIQSRRYPIASGGFAFTLSDVTELERQTGEIEASRNLLRTTLDTMDQGICVYDRDLRLLAWNERYIELAGQPRHLIRQGVHLYELVRWHAEHGRYGRGDPERLAAARVARMMAPDTGAREERVEPTGRIVDVRRQPMPDGGYAATFTDVTGRRKAELSVEENRNLLRATLESIDQGFAVFNAGETLVLWNQRWVEQWGHDPATVTLHITLSGIIRANAARGCYGPGDIDTLAEAQLEAVRLAEPGAICESVEVAGRTLEVRRFPMPDGGSAFTTTDVTVRRQDEVRRRTLEAQLRQSQKMEAIGTLAGGIAHDFNNILGAVLGYAEMAKDRSGEDTKLHGYLDRIHRAGNRAKALVGQILAFSRAGGGDARPIDLAEMVDECCQLLRATLPTTIAILRPGEVLVPGRMGRYPTDLRLQGGLATSIPVVADPIQLEQLVMNLATNAAHAMPDGGRLTLALDMIVARDIMVFAKGTLGPGRYARLTVTDTGHGMDTATVDRIFDPFFTTKDVGEGTGLGLSIVHGIVTALRGAISVDSAPGRGTTVCIFLPLAEGVTEADPDQPAAVATGTGERILLIDDEDALVELGEAMLADLGYRPTGFTDVRTAASVLARSPQRFDLVITDLTMPGMTGVRLAQEAASLRSDLPVIIVSGFTDRLDQKALPGNVRALLNKPVTRQDLAEAVASVLRR